MKFAIVPVALGLALTLLCGHTFAGEPGKEGAALASSPDQYHFDAYTFDTKEMYKAAGEGEGDPTVCKDLFAPPMLYDGRYIPIAANATVFGVVTVTYGKGTKIIPLFRWKDEQGRVMCGCNGPTPWYARQEKTEDALVKSVIQAIKKK